MTATTGGQDLTGGRAVRAADTGTWQRAFNRARYVIAGLQARGGQAVK